MLTVILKDVVSINALPQTAVLMLLTIHTMVSHALILNAKPKSMPTSAVLRLQLDQASYLSLASLLILASPQLHLPVLPLLHQLNLPRDLVLLPLPSALLPCSLLSLLSACNIIQ
jgi:hypothetical protein